MSRNLEQTLLSLLPSTVPPLPNQLIDLASSLLAQSRDRASTLKAEEEVGRSYACAHLACERLKISLDLPEIQLRPPIPPRIYKRLYAHLDNILPKGSGGGGANRTPKSKGSGSDGILGSGRRRGERSTPGKDKSLALFRTPTKGQDANGDAEATPSKSTGRTTRAFNSSASARASRRRAAGSSAFGLDAGLPPWIRPTILSVSTELNDQRIGRTVLAGMQHFVVPRGREAEDEWVNSNMTSLLAALLFWVSAQVTKLESGEDVEEGAYREKRKAIVKGLETARDTVEIKGCDDKDEAWAGWTAVKPADVDKAVQWFLNTKFDEMEWYSGVKDLAGQTDNEGRNRADGRDAHYADTDDPQLARKGDTMYQTRWELSERTRLDYKRWETEMLKRIEEKERSGDAMDVDTNE